MNALWWYAGWTRMQDRIIRVGLDAQHWRKVRNRKNWALYRLDMEIVRKESGK